jgi:hypothetical protein
LSALLKATHFAATDQPCISTIVSHASSPLEPAIKAALSTDPHFMATPSATADVVGGLLLQDHTVYAPASICLQVLQQFYDSVATGHPGIKNTIQQIPSPVVVAKSVVGRRGIRQQLPVNSVKIELYDAVP